MTKAAAKAKTKAKSPKSKPPKKAEFFSPGQVAEALRLNNGNATAAARVLKCCADTIRNYCDKYPEVKAARDSGREIRLDRAEEALDKAVDRGDGWAVCFILKTQGQQRGYIERQRVEVVNPHEIARAAHEFQRALAAGTGNLLPQASATGAT